ncbi:MAG: hypothetical protein J2O48_11550 [Solirubrobacterales bacterium]|nr:hypothetical protein [Solirubrobacterales bacterium]
MRLPASLRRRPSASVLISFIALFLALSGGAVAAVALPKNSVGTAQLRHRAVDHDKVGAGAVGKGNVNVHQVQVRVGGRCNGWSSVSSVNASGGVACRRGLPANIVTKGLTVSIPSDGSAGLVADESLTKGSPYQASANPQLTVSGSTTSPQLVLLTCTLTANGASDTQTQTVDLTPQIEVATTSVPLSLAVPQVNANTPAEVACSAKTAGGDGSPKVVASSQINAQQTLNNETVTSATSAPPVTVTTPSGPQTTTTATQTTTTGTTPTP